MRLPQGFAVMARGSVRKPLSAEYAPASKRLVRDVHRQGGIALVLTSLTFFMCNHHWRKQNIHAVGWLLVSAALTPSPSYTCAVFNTTRPRCSPESARKTRLKRGRNADCPSTAAVRREINLGRRQLFAASASSTFGPALVQRQHPVRQLRIAVHRAHRAFPLSLHQSAPPRPIGRVGVVLPWSLAAADRLRSPSLPAVAARLACMPSADSASDPRHRSSQQPRY